ncbi:MAG: cyclic nucleotide-binding domain-containing protein [Verrucomicrobiota bacterium]
MARRNDFLSWWSELEAGPRVALEERAEKLLFPAGVSIVTQGEFSDAMYVVMSGTLKVYLEDDQGEPERTLGYLGEGDLFGELGLLYDAERSATVRSTSEVKLVRIAREGFDFLMQEHPDFTRFLVYHLADRFKLMMQNISHISYCTQLRGNLPAFELLAVFQTIAGSGRDGLLSIKSNDQGRTGSFYFERGSLTRARYNHLSGPEAVWQVAVDSELPAAFEFDEADLPPDLAQPPCVLDFGVNDLLMEAAMRKDLGNRLERHLRECTGSLGRAAADCHLGPDTNASLQQQAERVWALLGAEPKPAEEVWKATGWSVVTFAEAVEPMMAAGLVTWRDV